MAEKLVGYIEHGCMGVSVPVLYDRGAEGSVCQDFAIFHPDFAIIVSNDNDTSMAFKKSS